MKKLLLTLGTVAAVAAPVASVVACGTTNEVANPEFQAVSVKGFTFAKDKVPYLTTDFKGFVEVVIGANRYLVPANDIKEEVKTAAIAEELDAKGEVSKAAAAATFTYTVKKDSVTSKDTRIKDIDSVIKGKHTVLAEATEVAKINAGKPGKVITYKTVVDVQQFLVDHQTSVSKDQVSADEADGKFIKIADTKRQSPLTAIATDFYASTFKAADDAKALAGTVTAAISKVRAAGATALGITKTSPSDDDLKAKKEAVIKLIKGAADKDAIKLILKNETASVTIA